MNFPAPQPLASTVLAPLADITLFDVTGADAASFLQGQLTQEVLHWQPNEIKRAAWCNAKGRMLATFYVWKMAEAGANADAGVGLEGLASGFRFIVASDVAGKVLPRLRMFVMRAKVTVSEPLATPLYATHSTAPAMSHDGQTFTLLNNGFAVCHDAAKAQDTSTIAVNDWLHAHTAAGVAWITGATSEAFVPQPVNFELVGGVNFRKGCYPGQEIVARSQYLGKLKLRAAIVRAPAGTQALQDVFQTDADTPVGRVIQAAQTGLALIEVPQALVAAGADLRLGSPTGAALAVQPLPYPVLDITA
jgi:tRNA-modifying protein YgfZ